METVLDNALFRYYYANVGIFPTSRDIPNESDLKATDTEEKRSEGVESLDVFMECLKIPLPTTFRVTAHKEGTDKLRRHISAFKLQPESINLAEIPLDSSGEFYNTPMALRWYPLAFQLPGGRNEIRRLEKYQKLHAFMVRETELGNLSRQEAVSMIPPLLLDLEGGGQRDETIHEGLRVLDMCAAPGSKTCQIVELLHLAEKQASLASGSDAAVYTPHIPRSVVVANDLDATRGHMMIHQVKRLSSPCVIATSFDASVFPTLHHPQNGRPLLFDRILCDVPCSGDGTLRKNKTIWKSWTPAQAYGLHSLQVDILTRGLQLLKVNGRLVYSTCSLNPIENEAVLAAVLSKFGDDIELVDVSELLPNLKRIPGLSHWNVQVSESIFCDTFEEAQKVQTESNNEKMYTMKASFFPPQAGSLGLERAWRIYPHLQNTGGFFIAVLRKKASMREQQNQQDKESNIRDCEDDENSSNHSNTETSVSEAVQPKAASLTVMSLPGQSLSDTNLDLLSVDPFTFQSLDSPSFVKVNSLFHLTDKNFPHSQLMIRATISQERNNLFLVSQQAKTLLQAIKKIHVGKVVYTGVLAFTRCDQVKAKKVNETDTRECVVTEIAESVAIESRELNEFSAIETTAVSRSYSYRLQNEALPLIGPFVSKRLFKLTCLQDLKLLLTNEFPKINEFANPELLRELDYGCHLFTLESQLEVGEGDETKEIFQVPVWKGHYSLNLLIHKKEKESILERLSY